MDESVSEHAKRVPCWEVVLVYAVLFVAIFELARY